MARSSIRRMRTFIEMHNMEQDIQVDKYSGSPSHIKYAVTHKQFGPPWRTEYLCQTLADAADCVNHIIYEIPIENATEVPPIGKD